MGKLPRYSAIAYGLVVGGAVLYFEGVGRLGLQFPVLAAYGAALVASPFLGWRLGRWYLPIDGERAGFELIIIPLLILCGSALLGGFTFSAVSFAGDSSGASYQSLLDIVAGAIYAAVLFVYVSWPVLLPSGLVAAVFLAVWARLDILPPSDPSLEAQANTTASASGGAS